MKRENWIKWDLSSRNDPATKFFLAGFKDKARAWGFFLELVSLLYDTQDGWVVKDEIFLEGFAVELGWSVEDVELALARLVLSKLFQVVDGRLASKKVLREMVEREKFREVKVESGRKGGLQKSINSRGSYQNVADAKRILANSTRVDKSRVDKSREDRNRKDPSEVGANPEKDKFGEYVFLSKTEVQKFDDDLGKDVLQRCIEKLDAWIASDPTVKRIRNGQNAGACFRSWVINSIGEEQNRAKRNGTNSQSAMQSNVEVFGSFLKDER